MQGAAPDPVAEDLYETDILAWSSAQADRLRRVAAGERVNDVDWAHVIEEIEDVGEAEVRVVRSALRQAMVHAMKAAAWPENDAARHWRHEAIEFLSQARADFQKAWPRTSTWPPCTGGRDRPSKRSTWTRRRGRCRKRRAAPWPKPWTTKRPSASASPAWRAVEPRHSSESAAARPVRWQDGKMVRW